MKAAATKVRLLFGFTGWPSGVLEIASWAQREGLAEAAIVPMEPDQGATGTDAEAEGLRAVGDRFLAKLLNWKPHVIGFRVEGENFAGVKAAIRAVRRVCDAEIVLGGPTATSHPLDVLQESGADYLFAGEAEEPFNQFLRLARERDSCDRQPEIPGLAYHYGGRVYHNTLPADGYERTVLDLDDSACARTRRCQAHAARPVAPREVIAANRLDWSLVEGLEGPLESLFFTGGRGCPGECSFCARLHGPEVRVKPARQLLEEIEAADAAVAAGGLRVSRWKLFEHVGDPALRDKVASWAAIYDEDFFLDRRRAVEFFGLWNGSPLRDRYRLSVQTNPCTLLDAAGHPHARLFDWIDRLKPMIQLGAESFHPELLARWHKRHRVEQLCRVLDALERTRQDYTAFILLTDFDSTAEELVEGLRLLSLEALRHPRMRIASTAFTIPLYDSDTRKALEFRAGSPAQGVRHFSDYERPQPGWLDPLTAELADRADAELHFALQPPHRNAALVRALEVVQSRLHEEDDRVREDPAATGARRARVRYLCGRADQAVQEVRESQFRAPEGPR